MQHVELTKSWWLHSISAVLHYDFTNLRNFALLSARCIYSLIFKKKMQSNQSVFASRPLPFSPKPSRLKMLIFQPPNILTPSENGRRGFKKQRGFKGSFALVIKRPLRLLSFTSIVCYLRQLCFTMYTESNFSYSLKSSSVTYAHLFNTEKNRFSTEKLRLWIT